MKKQTVFIFVVLAVVFLLVGAGQLIIRQKDSDNWKSLSPTQAKITEEPFWTFTPTPKQELVTIQVDSNEYTILSEKVSARTAYEALQKIAQLKGLSIEVKEYKYGVIVQKVGKKTNSPEFAWMYSVNGKTANIAADRFIVHPGDRIEWKYTKLGQ